MAVVRGPLLSLTASGAIGKAMVFADWKGQDYVRKYVIPANPRSEAQTDTRETFTWLHESYKYFPTLVTAAWKAYAKGKVLTGPNAYIQANLKTLREAANISNILYTKPVAGGPPATSVAASVAVAHQIALTPTMPAMPPAWSVTDVIAICMPKLGFPLETSARINFSTDNAVSPYVCTITGLTTGIAYTWGLLIQYLTDTGKVAYGGSVQGDATVT